MLQVVKINGPKVPGAGTNLPFVGREVVQGDPSALTEVATVCFIGPSGNVVEVSAADPLPMGGLFTAVSDRPNTAAVTYRLSVPDTGVHVVATLASRLTVEVQNVGGDDVALLYSSIAPFADGRIIRAAGSRAWKLGPAIDFWLRAPVDSATTVIIEELE